MPERQSVGMGGVVEVREELVDYRLMREEQCVRSLLPLLCWFECKRGAGECKGGQGGTGIFFMQPLRWAPMWVPSRA